MKNANIPINPILEAEFVSFGLTKREYFAGLAMQGLLSNSSIVDIHSGLVITWVAEHATRQADELLKQLEK